MSLKLNNCEAFLTDLEEVHALVEQRDGVQSVEWKSDLVFYMSDVAEDLRGYGLRPAGTMTTPSGARVLGFTEDWEPDGQAAPKVVVCFVVNAENILHADSLVLTGLYHPDLDNGKMGVVRFAEARAANCAALA